MRDQKNAPYPDNLKLLMGKKSYLLSKAQTLSEMGLTETVQPLYLSAAVYEEQIAALLDTENRELEAAVHRMSAASCYEQVGELSRAVNLYRAALSSPLHEDTRLDILTRLNVCLKQLMQQAKLITPSTLANETMPTGSGLGVMAVS